MTDSFSGSDSGSGVVQVLRAQRLGTLTAILTLSLLVLFSAAGDGGRGSSAAAATGFLQAPAGRYPPTPALKAEAYLVRLAPLETTFLKGLARDPAPIMAQRAWKPVAPASLTKIMTALVAREILKPNESIVFSSEAKAVEERTSDVGAGEVLTRDSVVQLALVSSANDAALALAEAAGERMGGGSFAERIGLFVRRMNERARELGMMSAHFENPVGLDAPGQEISAQDLARMAEEILARDPDIFAITRMSEARAVSAQGKAYAMAATNELLGEFPALAGGKTGMTDEAQGALLLLYPVNRDRTAIIVILKSEDRFGDGRSIIKWLEANCLASRGDSGERPCEP